MEKSSYMSAEEARKIAEQAQRTTGKEIFEDILKKIPWFAANGETECCVSVEGCYTSLTEKTVLEPLEQLGYNVAIDKGTAKSGIRWFQIKW